MTSSMRCNAVRWCSAAKVSSNSSASFLFKAFSDTDDRFVRFLESQYDEALANPNGTAAGRFFDRLIPQKLAARIGEMAVGDVSGEATDAQMGKRLMGELERRLTSVVGADALEVESGD